MHQALFSMEKNHKALQSQERQKSKETKQPLEPNSGTGKALQWADGKFKKVLKEKTLSVERWITLAKREIPGKNQREC